MISGGEILSVVYVLFVATRRYAPFPLRTATYEACRTARVVDGGVFIAMVNGPRVRIEVYMILEHALPRLEPEQDGADRPLSQKGLLLTVKRGRTGGLSFHLPSRRCRNTGLAPTCSGHFHT